MALPVRSDCPLENEELRDAQLLTVTIINLSLCRTGDGQELLPVVGKLEVMDLRQDRPAEINSPSRPNEL